MSKVIVAFLGGLAMGLTPAPVSFWPLGWVALVPLWVLIVFPDKMGKKYDKSSLKNKIILALVWGLGYHGLALFWITGVHPMTWMGVPWLASLAIAIFCWLFISFWGAMLVVFWAVGMTFFKPDSVGLRLLMGVALWCGLESFWSQGDLWWTALAYTQSPHNLLILQLGQFSGPITVTACLVLVNGLIAEGLIHWLDNIDFIGRKWNSFPPLPPPSRGGNSARFPLLMGGNSGRLLILSLGLILGLHLLGFGLYSRPVVTDNNQGIKVGIIQGNIPNEIKLYRQGWQRAIEGYTKGYNQLVDQGVDIVLTPETALPFFWDNLVHDSSFYQAILKHKIPAWLGAFGRQNQSFTNSLFTVTGEGQLMNRYDKIKLVPLGEYIPFEEFLGQFISRLSPLDAHLARGKPDQIVDTPFGRAIVGICYESAFSEHFRRQTAQGGEFIITASNNAHYSSAMPAQHHAQDVMRAIETDRWAARATNTGYSAILDSRGRTLWISGLNTYEVQKGTIYRRQTKTLYVKWGDWLTKVLGLSALGLWLKTRIK